MAKPVLIILAVCLLAGCAAVQHSLAGKHSPAIVEDIVEQVSPAMVEDLLEHIPPEAVEEIIEHFTDNIEAVVVLKMWWLIPGCLIGLGAAAVLLFLKQTQLAIALAAGFGVTLVLSITVFKHFALIGYIVLAVGLLIAGYALWRVRAFRQGFSQLFRTGEAVKPELDELGKDKIYGTGKDHGLAGNIQSKTTEKLVNQERVKIAKTSGDEQ